MSISTALLRSELAHRTSVAAKMFFPPLLLAIGFAIIEVLISLTHPVFIALGDVNFPVYLPYWEEATKTTCYIIADIAFCSLFISFTFRDFIVRLARKRAKLAKRRHAHNKRSDDFQQRGVDKHQRSHTEIRMEWERIRIERELHDYELQKIKLNTEPITDLEAMEIIVPTLCTIALLLLLLWPVILIITLVAVLILAIRGTLNLVLTRIVDLIFRGAFRL